MRKHAHMFVLFWSKSYSITPLNKLMSSVRIFMCTNEMKYVLTGRRANIRGKTLLSTLMKDRLTIGSHC